MQCDSMHILYCYKCFRLFNITGCVLTEHSSLKTRQVINVVLSGIVSKEGIRFLRYGSG